MCGEAHPAHGIVENIMATAPLLIPHIERYAEDFAANAASLMRIATDQRREQTARRLALRRAKLWSEASEKLVRLQWLEAYTENAQ